VGFKTVIAHPSKGEMMEALIYSAETLLFVLWLLLMCYRIIGTAQARNTSKDKNPLHHDRQEYPSS